MKTNYTLKHNVKINYEDNTIEITRAYSKAASKINSEQYKDLKTLRAENPGFKVVVKQSTARGKSGKGVGKEYIIDYITARKDDEFLAVINKLLSDKTISFFAVKSKFFEHYPELKDCKNKADLVIAA